MHDGGLGDDAVEIEEAGQDFFRKTELLCHRGSVPRRAPATEWRTPHGLGRSGVPYDFFRSAR